ncbi:MAG: protein kinase, partial [Planctomycetota bacterium]|nr:protein kinase [Planctomycetota bacterium]
MTSSPNHKNPNQIPADSEDTVIHRVVISHDETRIDVDSKALQDAATGIIEPSIGPSDLTVELNKASTDEYVAADPEISGTVELPDPFTAPSNGLDSASQTRPTDVTVIVTKPTESGETRPKRRFTTRRRNPNRSTSSIRIGKTKIDIPDDAEEVGPYMVLEEIARGGMGVVYKAYREDLNKIFALKVLIAGEHASEESLERFRREAQSAAKLDRHPNIIQVFDAGSEDELHYFTMDFVEGCSLAEAVRSENPLPVHLMSPRRSAEVVSKIARALHYAHCADIIHRDVKPHNVLLDMKGEPFLTDFGLAKNLDESGHITRTGSILGSPPFMPPEQARGDLGDIDWRSDIYSLGATLYFALCKRPPFEGDTILQTLRAVVDDEPVAPRAIVPGLHRDLETICLKAMDREADCRYASALEFAEDLEAFLDGRAISAVPLSRSAKARRYLEKHPQVLAALAVFVALLCALTANHFTKRARLVFRTEPSGATVYIDGEASGVTPLEDLQLSPGPHEMRAVHTGYREVNLGSIDFRRAETVSLTIPLVSSKGTLVVLTNPSLASLRIGQLNQAGQAVWIQNSRSPFFGDLPAGSGYIVEATAPGYRKTRSPPFKLNYGRERKDITLTLEPDDGSLEIEGQPKNTPVKIVRERPVNSAVAGIGHPLGGAVFPGEVVSITPLPFLGKLSLPTGDYTVTAGAPGLRTRADFVAVRYKETTSLRLDLSTRRLWLTDLGPVAAGAPVSFDVNGDGVLDLIVGRRGAPFAICSGDDGRLLQASERFALETKNARPLGVISKNNRSLIVAVQGGRIVAFDLRLGDTVWSLPHSGSSVKARIFKHYVLGVTRKGRSFIVDAWAGRMVYSTQHAKMNRPQQAPLAMESQAGFPLCAIGGQGKTTANIRVIDPNNGTEIWQKSIYRGKALSAYRSANNGQDAYVLVASGRKLIQFHPTKGTDLKVVLPGEEIVARPIIADFTGDDLDDWVFATETGAIRIVYGHDIVHSPREPKSHVLFYSDGVPSAPLIGADLDGDGAAELILSSTDRSLYAYKTTTNSFLFKMRPFSPLSNFITDAKLRGLKTERGRVVGMKDGDFDGDGCLDIAFVSDDGRAGVISGGPGPLAWSRKIPGALAQSSLDRGDLLVGTSTGYFIKLTANDGLRAFDNDILVQERGVQWTFADLDHDDHEDALICGLRTGVIAVSGLDGQFLWKRPHIGVRKKLQIRAFRNRVDDKH